MCASMGRQRGTAFAFGFCLRHCGDEEADERGKSAAGAVELLVRGVPTPGLPRMREVWSADVADTVAKWLGLAAAAGDSRGMLRARSDFTLGMID